MCEFFKPWRRKAGLVTLLMAVDCENGRLLVASIDSRLVVVVSNETATHPDGWLIPDWHTTEYYELESELDDVQTQTWQFAGLGVDRSSRLKFDIPDVGN